MITVPKPTSAIDIFMSMLTILSYGSLHDLNHDHVQYIYLDMHTGLEL